MRAENAAEGYIDVLIGNRPIEKIVAGIRPGEKIQDILVSEEEAHRAVKRDLHYVILPILPELRPPGDVGKPLQSEYGSANSVISRNSLPALLRNHKLLVEDKTLSEGDLLP